MIRFGFSMFQIRVAQTKELQHLPQLQVDPQQKDIVYDSIIYGIFTYMNGWIAWEM